MTAKFVHKLIVILLFTTLLSSVPVQAREGRGVYRGNNWTEWFSTRNNGKTLIKSVMWSYKDSRVRGTGRTVKQGGSGHFYGINYRGKSVLRNPGQWSAPRRKITTN